MFLSMSGFHHPGSLGNAVGQTGVVALVPVPDYRADDRSALQIDDVFGIVDHVAGTRLRSAHTGFGIVRIVPLAVRGPVVCVVRSKRATAAGSLASTPASALRHPIPAPG
jgi:hypothetical protein